MDDIVHEMGLPSQRRLLPTSADTNRQLPLDLAEKYTSEEKDCECDERTMNNFNENGILSLDVNYSLIKGRNRRYTLNTNSLLFAQRDKGTRIVDKVTKHEKAKGDKFYVPIASAKYDPSALKFKKRDAEGKCCRKIAERSQLRDTTKVGEVLSFEENSMRWIVGPSKGVGQGDRWQFESSSSMKRAIRMASSKVDTSNSDCKTPPIKQSPFGPQGLSAENRGSSVELQLKHKIGYEKDIKVMRPERLRSDDFINTGERETAKKLIIAKSSSHFDNLFSLNLNQDFISVPRNAQFPGVVPMLRLHENELSKSMSRDDNLPSINAISGVPRGKILTVVRKTVTGLEIERRSSTEIVSIEDRSRSCHLHLCTEHDPPRVKNRTINWVKNQRLLQNRIKV